MAEVALRELLRSDFTESAKSDAASLGRIRVHVVAAAVDLQRSDGHG